MTKSNLKAIATEAIKTTWPHMRETFDSWCEFDPEIPCVSFQQHEGGTTTHALFELINPFLYFVEMTGFTFHVHEDRATFSVSYGRYCRNPQLAIKYALRFKPEINALGWSMNEAFHKHESLILSTAFSFESDSDLLQKLIACMEALMDDRLVNELRPFLHYFDHDNNVYS